MFFMLLFLFVLLLVLFYSVLNFSFHFLYISFLFTIIIILFVCMFLLFLCPKNSTKDYIGGFMIFIIKVMFFSVVLYLFSSFLFSFIFSVFSILFFIVFFFMSVIVFFSFGFIIIVFNYNLDFVGYFYLFLSFYIDFIFPFFLLLLLDMFFYILDCFFNLCFNLGFLKCFFDFLLFFLYVFVYFFIFKVCFFVMFSFIFVYLIFLFGKGDLVMINNSKYNSNNINKGPDNGSDKGGDNDDGKGNLVMINNSNNSFCVKGGLVEVNKGFLVEVNKGFLVEFSKGFLVEVNCLVEVSLVNVSSLVNVFDNSLVFSFSFFCNSSLMWLGPKDAYYNFLVYLESLVFNCSFLKEFSYFVFLVNILKVHFIFLNDGFFFKSFGESLFLLCFVYIFCDHPLPIKSVLFFYSFLLLEVKFYFNGFNVFDKSFLGFNVFESSSFFSDFQVYNFDSGFLDFKVHNFFGDSFRFVYSDCFKIINLSSEFSFFYSCIMLDFFKDHSFFLKFSVLDLFLPYFNIFSLYSSFSCVILFKCLDSSLSSSVGLSSGFSKMVCSGMIFNLVLFCSVDVDLVFFNSVFISFCYYMYSSSSKFADITLHSGNFSYFSGCNDLIYDSSFFIPFGIESDVNMVFSSCNMVYYNSYLNSSKLSILDISSISNDSFVFSEGFICVGGCYFFIDKDSFYDSVVTGVQGIYNVFYLDEFFILEGMSGKSENEGFKYPGDWSGGSSLLFFESDNLNVFNSFEFKFKTYTYYYDEFGEKFFCKSYFNSNKVDFVFHGVCDFSSFFSYLFFSSGFVGFSSRSCDCFFYDFSLFNILDCSFSSLVLPSSEGDNCLSGLKYCLVDNTGSPDIKSMDFQVNLFCVDIYTAGDSCAILGVYDGSDYSIPSFSIDPAMDSSKSWFLNYCLKGKETSINIEGYYQDGDKGFCDFKDKVGKSQVSGCVYTKVFVGVDKISFCNCSKYVCMVEGCTNNNKKYLWMHDSNSTFHLYNNPFYFEIKELPSYIYLLSNISIQDHDVMYQFSDYFLSSDCKLSNCFFDSIDITDIEVYDFNFLEYGLSVSDFVFYWNLWCCTFYFFTVSYPSLNGNVVVDMFFSYPNSHSLYYDSTMGSNVYLAYVKDFHFYVDMSSESLINKASTLYDFMSDEDKVFYMISLSDVLSFIYSVYLMESKSSIFFLLNMQSHGSLFHSTVYDYGFLDKDRKPYNDLFLKFYDNILDGVSYDNLDQSNMGTSLSDLGVSKDFQGSVKESCSDKYHHSLSVYDVGGEKLSDNDICNSGSDDFVKCNYDSNYKDLKYNKSIRSKFGCPDLKVSYEKVGKNKKK